MPYFVTARCLFETYLLRPDADMNAAIDHWLEQTRDRFGLELFAYVAMSNHLHLVVRAPKDNLPEAMQFLLSKVARATNAIRNRRGPVWSDRYHAQVILDDDALFDRVCYTLMNPVTAGLVSRAEEWPGVTSVHATAQRKLSLTFERATAADDVRRLLAELRVREREAAQHRRTERRPSPSVQRVLAERPTNRPRNPKRSRQPLCFAGSLDAWKAFRELWKEFRAAYRVASDAFRARAQPVEFPFGSRPPWIRSAAS